MKFTLSWLKDHLETSLSLSALADALTGLGIEVEEIIDRAQSFAPFKVAYVREAMKHPDADRLKVLRVETADHGILQVVCGAPNARAGMKGIFAPDGSFIPGTGITLKKGMIRGQESNGMMVSEKEMGLSENHEGIIEVTGDIAVGTPFVTVFGLDDPVIDVKLTPNRADCAGVRGIARDLAAAGYGTLKPLNTTAVRGQFESLISVRLDFEEGTKNACPLFLGRYIRGVKNGESPLWLQKKLTSIGLRPISALVDITNYMTIDLNRPLHVFDADRVRGDIQVRLARTGETLAALNDKTYLLTDTMTAVCDETGVLGLGGIMGGASTGCQDGTVNVYLEAAYFDPLRTARTGRALQIDSDARYRFERGIDPEFTHDGMEIATRLVLELCGGVPSHVVVAGAAPKVGRTIHFDPARTKALAGMDVPVDLQQKILDRLGFALEPTQNGTWAVTSPSWRADVEGPADLVEEIARVHGFDKIPAVSVLPVEVILHPAEDTAGTSKRRARAALAARGLYECVTYSFMSGPQAKWFGANDDQAHALQLQNPINADWDHMRPSILPNLLHTAARNAARGFGNAALFEVGPAFIDATPKGQRLVAAGVRHGKSDARHWAVRGADRAVDAYDAKGDALAVLDLVAGVGADKVMITRDAPAWYHPGRSGVLRQGNVVLGYFGELHPAVLDTLDVPAPAVGFEVFLDAVPTPKKKGTGKGALMLSPLMPLSRDFSFVVDEKIDAETITRAIRLVDRTLITDAQVFDVYTGPGVPAGQKSVAVAVRLEPTTETLTDAQIEGISAKIIDAVVAKTGGALRG